ncbi:uncharacterized protein LOC115881990 isoform X2 [Sitophilus oryzae]|uniref:Uncharacterized protein LOC115881990 isoform X2 n=1 Tax=Sitophilus oryzae TaxID=7048 RepID=A0A6J2XX09_SITOR|nr:uncharacterized protein LOC115881990 isoform X2 [Sitophilus oryzae]
MFKKNSLLILLIAFGLVALSQEYVPPPTCFGQACPSSTTNCKQDKKSSSDKRRIEVTISCLDDYDSTLKDYYFEEPSNFDPHTNYHNTKYESVNEGYSSPQRAQRLDLTPYHGRLVDFF